MNTLLVLFLACQSASPSACLAESRDHGGYWDGDPLVESPMVSAADMRRVLGRSVNTPVTLDLCLRVNSSGEVADLVLQSTENPSVLEQSVVGDVRKVRFTSGKVKGRAVDVWMPVRIHMAPKPVTPSPRQEVRAVGNRAAEQ